MKEYTNTYLYEINTFVFLDKLSEQLNKKISLKNIPDTVWKDLKSKGFQYVWLMGVWQRSQQSRSFSLTSPELKKEYTEVLGDWTDEDVSGSPYAISEYKPDSRFGDFTDLKKLKEKLNNLGLKLILDFVPNHMGLDNAWLKMHPERFLSNKNYIEHGKDPYFAPWRDTLQINYASSETRKALSKLLLDIGQYCDGLRCDMAMLVINRIFEQTWAHLLGGTQMPREEFWSAAIAKVKGKFPNFIFMAEAYWGVEWELQQMGFDYTYDKTFYDRLVESDANDIRGHLRADIDYQNRSVRFIENHDELRSLLSMPQERAEAAAVIAMTVPGLKMVFDGQFEGKKIRIPVHLKREPLEEVNERSELFYQKLMDFVRHQEFASGDWKLIDVNKAGNGNESFNNILAWIWTHNNHSKIVVVNFSDVESQAWLDVSFLNGKNEELQLKEWSTQEIYERNLEDIKEQGLYVALKPWQSHLFFCVGLFLESSQIEKMQVTL